MFGGEALPFTRHSDVLHANPTDPNELAQLVEELKRRGNAAFAQKSFEEAEALYSKAIEVNREQNPLQNQHIFLANRSAARCTMGKLAQALEDARESVAWDSNYAKGHFRQAQVLSKLKRYKEALRALERAKDIEPANKSVNTLYEQVLKLEKDYVPAQEDTPAASSPKRVTRVEVAEQTTSKSNGHSKSAPSAAEASPKDNGAVEDDDEVITGEIRGYKKLADGRVTTFFNNELSEEAKKLIGDIAPQKIADAQQVQIKNVDGGSAWNQGNTFEEKNMTLWAKETLQRLFNNEENKVSITMSTGVVLVQELTDLKGDASIAVVRGSKRYIFDFSFVLKCRMLVNGDASNAVEGELRFLDMSSDCDDDYDVEVVVPSRYQSATGKALYEMLSATSGPLRKAVHERLEQFVKAYHQF